MKKKLLLRLNANTVFILLAAFFGLIFVFSTPLLWGNDETAHFARVYQLSEGHMTAIHTGNTEGTGYGGYIPSNIDTLINVSIENFFFIEQPSNLNVLGTHQFQRSDLYTQIRHQKPSKQTELYSFSNTTPYSVAAYLPAVAGVIIARALGLDIEMIIWIARLCDLAFFIGCVYLALRALSFTRTKWLVFTVALIPMTLYQASIITADTVTNAVAILFSALFIKAVFYKRTLSKLETFALFACTFLLPIVKPALLFLALLAFIVPNEQISKMRWAKWFKWGSILLGIAAYAYWSHLSSGESNGIGLLTGYWKSVSPSAQTHWLIRHGPSFIEVLGRTLILQDNTFFIQFFGFLGNNYVQIPAVSVVASLGSLGLAYLAVDAWKVTKAKIIALWGIIIVSFVAVFATLYITFSSVAYPVVEGIQGRYFLPLAILTLIGLSPLAPMAWQRTQSNKSFSKVAVAICVLVIVSLSFSALKWLYLVW